MVTFIFCAIIIALFCYRSHKIELFEKNKGLSKGDWKHYRQMLIKSSQLNKKAPVKELN